MVNKRCLDPEYQKFRKTVLMRDKYTCQMPYCEAKHNLVVHHIQKYTSCAHLRTDPENGITLCRKCHHSTFGKEKHYASLFLSIILYNKTKKKSKKK